VPRALEGWCGGTQIGMAKGQGRVLPKLGGTFLIYTSVGGTGPKTERPAQGSKVGRFSMEKKIFLVSSARPDASIPLRQSALDRRSPTPLLPLLPAPHAPAAPSPAGRRARAATPSRLPAWEPRPRQHPPARELQPRGRPPARGLSVFVSLRVWDCAGFNRLVSHTPGVDCRIDP
jgi:hypothetical protein